MRRTARSRRRKRGKNMNLDAAYRGLMVLVLAALTGLSLLSLVRCILGPRISDRVLAVNMIGTLTIVMVAATVVLLGEGYLADIALIYAMISFLSVVVLCKVYTGIYREMKHEQRLVKAEKEEAGEP